MMVHDGAGHKVVDLVEVFPFSPHSIKKVKLSAQASDALGRRASGRMDIGWGVQVNRPIQDPCDTAGLSALLLALRGADGSSKRSVPWLNLSMEGAAD